MGLPANRQIDLDKLCETMFLSGLYLSCEQASNPQLISHVIDQVDAVMEHDGFKTVAQKQNEIYKLFQGNPVELLQETTKADEIAALER